MAQPRAGAQLRALALGASVTCLFLECGMGLPGRDGGSITCTPTPSNPDTKAPGA